MAQVGQQGWGQQTPATRAIIAQAFGAVSRSTSRKRKRRASSASSSRPKSRKRSKARGYSRGKPSRLVKGSAAAKRYMAMLRKKRK